MGLVFYTGPTAGPITKPAVSIGKDGRISINSAACKEIDTKYKLAKIGYDSATDEVVIKFVLGDEPGVFTVMFEGEKHKGRRLHCKRFLDWAGIDYKVVRRFTPTWDSINRTIKFSLSKPIQTSIDKAA